MEALYSVKPNPFIVVPWGKVFEDVSQVPVSNLYAEFAAEKDDGSGTYTGSASALIENPADIIYHLMLAYSSVTGLSSSDFNITSGGSLTLGSFVQARTDLNDAVSGDNYELSVCLTEAMPMISVIQEIRRHCPGLIFYRNLNDGKFQLVLYESSPSSEKDYGTTFSWDAHISKDHPFKVRETPTDQLYTRVYVNYRYFAPQGRTLRTAYIDPNGSDDGEGNDDSTRESNAGTYESRFNIQNTWEGDFPWIVDKDTAVALRNYIFDRLSQPLLRVEFTTYLNASDLRLGHVINFASDVDDYVIFPKYGDTTTWASKDFQVTEIRRTHSNKGELYTIKALEV